MQTKFNFPRSTQDELLSSQGLRCRDDPRRLLSQGFSHLFLHHFLSQQPDFTGRELMFPELKNETLKASIRVLVGDGVRDNMKELNRQSFQMMLHGSECYCCRLVAQSCPTLCDPMDCSPPGPSVHGILQARILEWVAMPSSRGSSRPKDQTLVSCNGRWVLYD